MRKSESQSQILWREFLNKSASLNSVKNSTFNLKESENSKIDRDNSDLSRNIVKSKVSQYKSQEEYYDEIILLKKNIVTLKGENEMLKSKIRKADETVNKKDKELSEIINHFENQNIVKDSQSTNFIVMKKLQQQVFQLKSELKFKEEDILTIKNDIKFTKINEMKLQNDVYLQEIRSLKQIVLNFRRDESNSNNKTVKPFTSAPVQTKQPSSVNEKYKILLKKYQALLKEHKNFQTERDQLILEECNKFENNQKEIKSKPINKEKEYIAEIERLKSINSEILNEKSNIEKKLNNINTKYELLQEKYELKSNECEILRKKVELQDNNKVLSKSKTDENVQSKSLDEKCNKLTQLCLLSYFNREKILEESSINLIHNSNDIVTSAIIGYYLREKFLNK